MKNANVSNIGFLVLFTLALAGPGRAAPGGTPTATPKPGDVSPRQPVDIQSRELLFERASGLTRFLGGVRVTHGNLDLDADEVRATSGNRQATAEGHVRAVDRGMAATLTCGHLEYRDLMRIITAHDEPMLTSVDDKGRPVTLVSRQMEFYSDQKSAIANQSVLVTHADGYAQAGKAVLLQDKGEILLEGEPRVFTTQGDFSGRLLKLDLRGNRFEAEGGVEVNFYPTPQAVVPRPPASGVPTPGAPKPPAPPAASAGASVPTPAAQAPFTDRRGFWGVDGR